MVISPMIRARTSASFFICEACSIISQSLKYDVLTITEDNAVAGSNTAVLTPLALTISNPDDNDGTISRPKVLLQSTDVGGNLLN